MTIDLHGYNVEETTSMVLNALFHFENDPFDSVLKIITGKGSGAVKLTVLNLLDEENWIYHDQGHSIAIFRSENFLDEFEE